MVYSHMTSNQLLWHIFQDQDKYHILCDSKLKFTHTMIRLYSFCNSPFGKPFVVPFGFNYVWFLSSDLLIMLCLSLYFWICFIFSCLKINFTCNTWSLFLKIFALISNTDTWPTGGIMENTKAFKCCGRIRGSNTRLWFFF